MMPGPFQIIIILLLLILFFGASRVPSIAENLAKGIRSFKKGLQDEGETPKAIEKKKDESKAE